MVGLVQHVFSNTIANATGTITIWNISGNSTTVAATNVIRPQDWNSTHNMSVTLTGNTAFGNTNVVGGTNIVFSAGNGIAFSGDSAGSSIGIFMAKSASAWNFPAGLAQGQGSIQTIAPTSSSLFLYPWYPEPNVTWSNIVLPVSLSSSLSNGASSCSGAFTVTFGLYSLSSFSLSSMTTATWQMKYSQTSTAITYSFSAGASSFTQTGTANMSLFNGPISMYIPFATSISGGGSYFIGYVMSAAGTTASSASAALGMSFFGAALNAVTWGKISSGGASAANISNTGRFDPVVYSAATGAFPASIPIGSTNSALNYVSNFAFFEVVNS